MTNIDNGGNGNTLDERMNSLEMAFRTNGLLGEIAQASLTERRDLTPDETADLIMEHNGEGQYRSRHELEAFAPERIKASAAERQEDIFGFASELGMRKAESLPPADLEKIDPFKAVFMIEGGANKSSVVRREVELQAMSSIYGAEVADKTLFQFGSGSYLIPREKNGKPNTEYKAAQEIGGQYIPDDDTLTQFRLNVISALQTGYEIVTDTDLRTDFADIEGIDQIVWMARPDSPILVHIQPTDTGGGFRDAFTALEAYWVNEGSSLNGKQPVIATNGQYRPKGELQANQWASEHGISFSGAPVALGDEPGFTVEHMGDAITTGNRAPIAYINEMVVLHRLLQKAAQ